MRIHGFAAALLLTGSALALSACGNMGMGSPQSGPAPSSRTQADRQAVAHVQTELQQLGFYNGAIDGSWGSESRSAMANFQQSKGLPPSGDPDQPSLNALASAAPSGTTASTSGNAPPPSSSIPSISEVQQELQQLGYYRGRIDGVWGPGTRSAMASFQRTQGLPVTGQGDMRSMNALAATAQSSATGASGNVPPPAGGTGTSYPSPASR